MFQNIQAAIKLRTLFVLILIHAGLILGICALSRQSFPNGWDSTSTLLCASIVLLYGGVLLAALFILIPLLPWIRRAHHVEHWSERVVHELPIVIEQLPKLVTVIQSLVIVWNEAKTGSPSSRQEDDAHPRK